MANENDMFLVGFPLAMAIFAALLNDGAILSIFAAIGSLATALAAAAAISIAGGIQLFGSGVEIKDFTIKLTFITTFLTAFFASNVLIGLNLILAMPLGIGIIFFGVLATLYVFGMFGMVGN